MLKTLLLLCICSALISSCCSADCEVYGLTLNKGESKTVPGKCSLVTCTGKGSDGPTLQGCPNAYAPAHCKFVPADLNKPYPGCCPHWDC